MPEGDYEIKRSTAPTSARENDRMIKVHFELSEPPVTEWAREFHEVVRTAGTTPRLDLTRPEKQYLHRDRGYSGRPPCTVDFFIGDVEELAGAVRAIDECIATTNRRYHEVVIPREAARKKKEAEDKAQRDAEQQRLDDIASQLPPP